MSRPLVAVVGAGQVGATTAQRIGEAGLADVALIDIVEGLPQGKSLDLAEAAPILGADARFIGSNDLAALRGSDVVVVTAGLARKPGMSREDLLQKNAAIVGGIADAIAEEAPEATVIVVSNPLDVMTWLTHRRTRFPKRRVMGMAGVLDSARFSAFIGMELGVSVKDIRAMVLGGHGDQMVPLPRFTTVAGVPVTELIAAKRLEEIVQRTRDGGAEIVALLKTGSAFYAPSAAAAAMVAAVLRDEKRVLPVCALLEGEYGISGVFVGAPARLGRAGIEAIVELKLTEAESAALRRSAESVRSNCALLEKLARPGG
jgi:malate dehydrogenase